MTKFLFDKEQNFREIKIFKSSYITRSNITLIKYFALSPIEKIKEVQSGVYAKMRDIARKHSPDIRQVLKFVFIFSITENLVFFGPTMPLGLV